MAAGSEDEWRGEEQEEDLEEGEEERPRRRFSFATVGKTLGTLANHVGESLVRTAAAAGELLQVRDAPKAPLLVAGPQHTIAAFDALTAHLLGAESGAKALEGSAAAAFDLSAPLFVSWHKRGRLGGDTRLRGCIGTLEPRPLRTAVTDYALTSALRDRRFPPIEAKELPQLRCTVSLLSSFEPAAGWEDWEIGTHGLIIEFADPHTNARRTATFLPEVAAHEGWDKQQTIDHLIRKAGHNGSPLAVRPQLKVTRYQSTTYSMSYEDWRRQNAEDGGQVSRKLRKPQPMVTVSAAQ